MFDPDYDEFESLLVEAGWALDEIESMWQEHYEYANDTWEPEEWDRD
jgi:hypothetical protein